MSATNFKPLGSTVLANVASTAASVFVTSNQNVGSWLITNAGTTDVFFRLSTNPATVAAIPVTSGTSAPGQMINAGDTYVMGLPSADGNGSAAFVSNVTVSAVTSTGTSQLFITPVQAFAE
jgi:hypothetical protein